MERLILDKLLDHMISNEFFSSFQHGFIPGKSYVTQLLETLDEITDAIEQGYDVDIIYLDFCKAFDKIPHQRQAWGQLHQKVIHYITITLAICAIKLHYNYSVL